MTPVAHVLLVDDEHELRAVLADYPHPHGMRVGHASDAQTARAAIQAGAAPDEVLLAEALRDTPERAGYEVAVAESAAIALELLGAARFAAIITDLRMPDMDGAELWRAVRERNPALAERLLFITGDTISPAASQSLRETRRPALEKPFTSVQLLRAVQALLG